MSRSVPVIDSERVSYVVHELRSPLAIASGYTSFLVDGGAGALDPEQREILDRVRRSLTALERLLNDTAEFARLLVTPAGDIPSEEVDLREPLGEAAELCALLATDAEMSLEELHGGLPLPVVGDPLAARQCILAVAAWIARGNPRGRIRATVVCDTTEVRVDWRSSGMQAPSDLEEVLRDALAPVPGLADTAAWRLGLAAAAGRLPRMGGSFELRRDGDDVVVTLRFLAAAQETSRQAVGGTRSR